MKGVRSQQIGKTIRLPEATWALLERMHATGLYGRYQIDTVRRVLFTAAGDWLTRDAKYRDTMKLLKRDTTLTTKAAEKVDRPKAKKGRHERLDEIYSEVCDEGEELANFQPPLTAQDRADIRKSALKLLALMDEHERLD